VAVINLAVNQVVAGTALDIFVAGITEFSIVLAFFGGQAREPSALGVSYTRA
jgi:ABC-type uncharacterized transport system permease subunit